jgi:hypothetical protein
MRPTWHFVTPSDIGWLIDLTGPRVQRAMAPYHRRLELDARTLTGGSAIVERALGDRRYSTRAELGQRLQRGGLTMAGQRLAHLMMHIELAGVICSGPRRGREFTYALLAERAPRSARMTRDEALATLGRRYFTSHGPATVRDFVWWSGLKTPDATRALDIIRARREDVGGRRYWICGRARPSARRDDLVRLLPIYDEYLVAYRDRDVPYGPSTIASSRGPVNFRHALVIDGHVAGTWRTARHEEGVQLLVVPLRRLSGREKRALDEAVERYERFLSVPVALSVV